MKKTAIALTLGLSLAMAGFAQPKTQIQSTQASPSTDSKTQSAASTDSKTNSAASSKSNPPKAKAPGRASGPTVIKANPQPSQLMMALDANEDGKLSLEEIKAAVKAFKTLDENEDGELTLNEFGPLPVLAKQNRASALDSGLKSITPTGPSQSGAKPSGRLGKKPTALANRTTPGTKKPSTKKPSARATRPGVRPRPSSKPGTGVAQKNARGDGTSAKSSETPTGRATPRRIARKAPARKVSKVARAVDPDIQTLIDETAAVTELIRKAAPKIKNLAKKQAAQNWAQRGSRSFLRSLKRIQGQDKSVKLVEANQKLEEVRKLLE